jgi:hypothetical protein
LLIGGEHQLLHIVPVAAALSRDSSVATQLFAASEQLADATATLMQRLNGGPYQLSVLRLPAALELLGRSRIGSSMKVPRLLWHAARLRECAALVTAERTSAVLKRLPGACPPMIHLRHGAGDRAVGFERRIARFDQLIVAGDKDRFRTIAAGLLPAERCHACGYIKLSALRELRTGGTPLFANDRPTVLYNPHFRTSLSSWHRHGLALIDHIRACSEFNLIVAPHVRLLAGASARTLREFEKLSVSGQVLVDAGSPRCLDMTYTLAANLYVGDVSSQVYEFAAEPRPCVFLNSHGVKWRGNPDYRMWEMGEVVNRPDEVVAALRRAGSVHAGHEETQRRLVAEALGNVGPECAERAARVIRDSMIT